MHQKSFAAFTDAAEARFGRIDVLINNAGVMPLFPLAALKQEEWTRMIDVNIHGVLDGIAAALPRFVAQRSGHVVNVASIAAHFVMPSAALYCATKYAVWAITEGFARSMTISAPRSFPSASWQPSWAMTSATRTLLPH